MANRFSAGYLISDADYETAKQRALNITVEQTVEIPRDIVPAGYVEDEILGRLEALEAADGGYIAEISYSLDDVGGDFLQLLNVLFGNSSILSKTRLVWMKPCDGLEAITPGPRFGRAGFYDLAGVSSGPLLMSAIKPVGLSTAELARLAGDFARGGMDFVKDDHGLVDQKTAPFSERLAACVDAIGEANAKTGFRTRFIPNITAEGGRTIERAYEAKEKGAGGVMLAPALAGYDIARQLAADADFGLPVISHPAFSGANVVGGDCGFSHRFYFGTLQRLMGVDATVYPNFGGRFGFSRDECLSIVDGCSEAFSNIKPILPAPGGGMTFERVPEMKAAYGKDVVYLIGGALIRERATLADACKRLAEAVRAT
ncbi:RuBisCO large subunit C-terminal-like domain-containing protein [Martelella mediterranea]|uniref:2,3-diketo-5-methylthiopentyl-1-phosphate enolase n=1 Tax=Martelella mediterranea DSM 17316 TaxID=1122214 RepID=A0A1U9YZP8_9HYPH|nr:RuBisCO large subunit C-terminal-like domain-containing protein [Martelella mediterranea]AQZ50923.1 2,3-diketo-5-methylthiopentyl-1-phosphate enolase [Martelella mediterranea DSM 17316]